MIRRIAFYAFIVLCVAAFWFFSPREEPEIAFGAITASSTTYSTAGTFTYIVSTNACEQVFELWGAGGSGGLQTNQGGGGGGGGAYARATSTYAAGTSISLVVGSAASLDSGTQSGSSTVTVSGTVIWGAQGGRTANNSTGAGGGLFIAAYGQYGKDGGTGGTGQNTNDTGGGGGGSGGPDDIGGSGLDGNTPLNGAGGTGGRANGISGAGAGGAGGNAGNGQNGTSDITGGGGGGGNDDTFSGGAGGAPGGGGGGSESGGGVGGRGQVIVTEWVNDAGCVAAATPFYDDHAWLFILE